ncbi:MAG: PilW family protein [Thermodesulfobacteriota bacterium]
MLKNNHGFTIVELLIATAILAFIIAGMTIALSQQQRQFNITRETVDLDQTGRSLLDFIATEVRNTASRQSKSTSIQFVNGGSIKDESNRCLNDTSSSGTKDSEPDCITMITWDIARGMETDPANPADETLNEMPSTANTVVLPSDIDTSSNELRMILPNSWFDAGQFIDGTLVGSEALVGVRSRTSLCNPDPDVSCADNPERCSECSFIFKGVVQSNQELRVTTLSQVLFDNFPVTFTSISQLMAGVVNTSNGVNYGFMETINSTANEASIVKTKTLRLDPVTRELQLSEDGGDFETIAGGQSDTPEGLEMPGVVDLQFVFNLQDPDGLISKVGFCEDGTNCADTTDRFFNDFSNSVVVSGGQDYYDAGPAGDLTCCVNREKDIRSVEIYLVLKSKTKPRKLTGGLFTQDIPAIGDVAERKSPEDGLAPDQSSFKEPEEGFMYRVFSTTVYLRNMAREEFG